MNGRISKNLNGKTYNCGDSSIVGTTLFWSVISSTALNCSRATSSNLLVGPYGPYLTYYASLRV